MENQRGSLPYEQPSLNKYGTMKEITLGSSGSGADFLGRIPNENTTDITVNNENQFPVIDDYFVSDINTPGTIFPADPIRVDTRLNDPG
jgi:hypothetical protein